MSFDDIAQVEETIQVLIDAELQVDHRFGGHERPVSDCPLCRRRAAAFR